MNTVGAFYSFSTDNPSVDANDNTFLCMNFIQCSEPDLLFRTNKNCIEKSISDKKMNDFFSSVLVKLSREMKQKAKKKTCL